MAWADTQNPEDIELAKRAVEAACQHPEQFSLQSWRCGTVMCIGGWMCWLANDKYGNLTNKDVSSWINGRGFLTRPGWLNLFNPVKWPDRFLTTDPNNYPDATIEQLRERFAYWLETGL